MNDERYEGKPFLRLLELYVLWGIGELDEDQKYSLTELTPKLQKTYGSEGEWFEIVSRQMDLPNDFPATLKKIWDKNKLTLESQGVKPEPEVFAQQFVDNNFMS